MRKLSKENKQKIIDYISTNDPDKKIIIKIEPNTDYKGGYIRYNTSNLKLHRRISELNDEEYVRAYLIVKLVYKLEYPLNSIELEVDYDAGRPKTIRPRIDIILRDNESNVFLFIETKAPDKFESDKELIEGQLFNLAKLEGGPQRVKYLVYYSINEKIDDVSIIIDHHENPKYADWFDNGSISLDRLPKGYGVAKKAIFVNKNFEDLEKGERSLDKNFSKNYLHSLRDNLHNVLWGGGEMFYNEIFSNLVKLFLAKIYDEETTQYGDPYRFQVEFKNGNPETSEEIYKKINTLFKDAQKLYLGYSDDMLKDSVGIDKEKINEGKIAFVVESLQGISLLENENKDEGDVLGDFFEGIVSKGFKQDKGQFFTHSNLVQFILYALEVDKLALELVNGKENLSKPRLPFICDPSCGSGTFLIETMNIITNKIKNSSIISKSIIVKSFLASNFPEYKENSWAREYIYGIEKNSDLALAAKVNMVLHGDGSVNIFAKDGLKPFDEYEIPTKVSVLSKRNKISTYDFDVNEGFDLVVSNPPFAIPLTKDEKKKLSKNFSFANKTNSENLFVERWYQLLKEGGKIGVVLPESFFDTSNNKYIRLFLYKHFKIMAVVSIPGGKDGAFQPYTGTKTNLLFAIKKSEEEVKLYDESWALHDEEFVKLKNSINSIKKGECPEDKAKIIISKYLRNLLNNEDISLSSAELLKKYNGEINAVGRSQEWWIFGEVAKKIDYDIFMARTDNIGYKRTSRPNEQKKPNYLFEIDSKNEIFVDFDNPKNILDYMISRKLPQDDPNIFTIKFSEISKSLSLRLDVRLHAYLKYELPELLANFKYTTFPLRNAILEIRNGKDVKKDNYSDNETDFAYPTVNNIKPEKIITDDILHINNIIGGTLEKYKLDVGDLIITRSGTVGVSKVFDINGEKTYIPSGYLIVLKIDENIVKTKFLEFYLNSIFMRSYFEVFATGKSQKNISQTDIKNIPVPIVDDAEQINIIKEIIPLISEIEEKEEEIKLLKDGVSNKFIKRLVGGM